MFSAKQPKELCPANRETAHCSEASGAAWRWQHGQPGQHGFLWLEHVLVTAFLKEHRGLQFLAEQKSLEPASHVLPGGSRVLKEGSLGLLSSGLRVRVTVGGLLEAAGPT